MKKHAPCLVAVLAAGFSCSLLAVAGTQTLYLPAGANTLAFRYAGTGSATLSDFADFSGTMLIFR